MLDTVHSTSFNPNRILLVAGTDENSLLYSRHENLKKYQPKESENTAAYVCKDFTCSLPIKSALFLREKMTAQSAA